MLTLMSPQPGRCGRVPRVTDLGQRAEGWCTRRVEGARAIVWRAVVIGTALLVLLGACSSGTSDSDSAAPGDLSEARFRSELVNISPPSPYLDALGLEATDPGIAGTLEIQYQEGVEECMRALGWPYDAHVSVWTIGDTWLPSMTREEFASIHGFGSRLRPEDLTDGRVVSEDPTWPYISTLSNAEQDAYMRHLMGDPDSGQAGCEELVASHFFGGFNDSIMALLDASYEQLLTDEEYQRATELYTQCTSDRGVPWLDDPEEPMIARHEGVYDHDLSQQQEVDAALAELECRYRWEREVRSIRYELEVKFVEENRELLAEMRRALQ